MLATETKHYSREGSVHWFTFDNWYDYVAFAENGETGMDLTERESRLSGNDRWYGGATFEETMELARNGWQAGTDQLNNHIKSFENTLPSQRVRLETVMDITGPGVLDFGRWATGHPEAWMIQQETEVHDPHAGNIIRIVYNISASSGVSTREMMDKGATIVGFIDLLERAGKRVELDLVAGIKARNGRTSVRTQVRVKEANTPVDIERIAFAIAHPASFRRIVFSLLEMAPALARKDCGIYLFKGYGMPEDWEVADAFYIPASAIARLASEAGRIAWVKEQLAAQGVVFDE